MKCYQCNSQKESDCESSDAEVLKKYSKDCVVLKEGTYKGKEPIACRKLVQYDLLVSDLLIDIIAELKDIDSSRRVVRECAYTGDKNLDGMRKQGNKGVKVLFYQCQNTDQVGF
ncbi:unnamed protein product [Anisakis simplex]|uniref:Protein quiver n=1 Tax=Anisakis simplex TaxID=6269 RepID=A0A0M3JAJ1_ANISI|nr:unnamed protein product [Anisakis simplex]